MPKCPFGKPCSIPGGCKKCMSYDKETGGCMKASGYHPKKHFPTSENTELGSTTDDFPSTENFKE